MSNKLFPNITASYYDGETQIACDCIDITKCKFVMSEVMPLEPDGECCYQSGGNCHCIQAKLKAMKHLRGELDEQIKAIEMQIKEG